MDKYNERRRNSRKKEIPFSGTRGFGACSSSALARLMLASHCDGNFKLYRLLSALGINLSSSYGDVVIAFDEDMKNHRAEIDSKVPKSKSSQTCGDSIFKAARSDAGKFQKLDETGIMMRSYRHGIVDRAVNMHHGETFRHTHFMHLDLPEKACTFLCGDVIYRYWDWAKKVASLFPEYKPMIEGMKTFLGRMHAKVHVWYCQIIWVGHWMSEAALTLGEEQEQVFFQNVKIWKCNKAYGDYQRDHLTAAVLFWNDQKEKGMVNQLIKRRERALKQIEISNKQLESDISKYKLKIEQLPILLGELRKAAKECKAGKEHLKDESPLQQAQNSLEGYNAHIKILQSRISRIATTSGQRIKFRKAITLMSKKRSKLIAFISANSKFKIQEDNLLTGHFPWQNLSGSQCRSNSKYNVVKR
ncbi:hypothetical protein DAPPUDRAFT_330855 [Daphnia pulex]|uniref:Uncharacterized protein n=1 Tax=Daphnia pulex TaxID=6669 RepID=E9HKT6_DAPPU|nr:hypothetical protein DAPPUDRAFT_330855 [Daphnia pulex]|eukprot:EFX67640.1 hypothetical protein DAPPUDRAFT_330855 [Daphnia pulex]